MKNNRIIESWDKIEPSHSAHDRMLSAVLEQNRLERERKEKVDRMKENHKTVWVKWGAVAACLCLIIGGVIFTNNRPQTQQGDTGSGIDGTVPGGALPEGVDPVTESIAVYPPKDGAENVADAIFRELSKAEVYSEKGLGVYLPTVLPDGYYFKNAGLHETTMKDGTKYYLIRADYTTGDENVADFAVWLMTYEPDTENPIYTLETLPQALPDNGTFHVAIGELYVGIDPGDLTYDEIMLVLNSIKE